MNIRILMFRAFGLFSLVFSAPMLTYANSSVSPSSSSSTPSSSVPATTYLDSAASWEVNEKSLAEFLAVSRMLGNSSGINPHAEYLRRLEKDAARIIWNKIHCRAHSKDDSKKNNEETSKRNSEINANFDQIHFLVSSTLANNIAILGVAYKNPGCHLITSKIEHKSVLNVFKELEKHGYTVTYLNVDSRGKVDLKQLQDSIRSNTKLISIQMLNSEIGVLQDLEAIGNIAREYGIVFHSDASQAFCKYPIDIDAMCVDLLTISGYKIGAPKGIAALYIRDSSKLQPIIFGSGDDFVPGSRSTPLICAFAKAVETFSCDLERLRENFNILKNELLKIGKESKNERVYINSFEPSHILSISIEGVLLKDILARLKKFSFSAGCSCLGQDKSNVIDAIDPQKKLPGCTLRISFMDTTSPESLVVFAQKLKEVVEQLRKEKQIDVGCEQESPESKGQKELNESLDKILNMLK